MSGPTLNGYKVEFGWNKLITLSQTHFLKKKVTRYVKYEMRQNCAYQGEALNVMTAFSGVWNSKNFKTNIKNIMNIFFQIEIFVKFITPHAV